MNVIQEVLAYLSSGGYVMPPLFIATVVLWWTLGYRMMSLTFIWNKHQFRVNYSETAARADFKELSPAQFKDPVFNRNVIGNPALEVGKIKHYDLRWDMYFTAGEFVSLSFFYKEFINIIEMIILPGASGIISFDIAGFAENSGVELEFFKDFFIHR